MVLTPFYVYKRALLQNNMIVAESCTIYVAAVADAVVNVAAALGLSLLGLCSYWDLVSALLI